ncbi:DUF1800 domain-containing protein [Burkholderiaceae bacterium FT117]|uniref:DUF1800 domain-containing protein n=1 Tax=Zeimonas sediminis TaxID=2944268 RepID=UPI0023430A5B|nr:DUF1800 domain-containing protein [Zeimonas sediminis]MCM5569770.1 DUF1800 domain-containing protein [Zeimonas sediminis]
MRWLRNFAGVLVAALALSACGGGSGDGSAGNVAGVAGQSAWSPADLPASKSAAARFLSQGSFGASDADVARVESLGYSAWIEDQFAKPASTHLGHYAARTAALEENQRPRTEWVYESFWKNAIAGEDALRQRVAFALSQIFVVSLTDGAVAQYPRGVAGYLDMLGENAFGNFRKLIEDVSLHPMMGLYLSHLRNQKADPATGRVPDENYARELMQLFTIGLHELNQDGTVRLDSRREPIETYTNEDVTGLARVFTGFSWAGPDSSSARFFGGVAESYRDITPMRGYPQHHEAGPKSFLGTTVTATTPESSLKAALDHLFAHPNVGPFFGKQLIQRLVTSNPSPAYVARVAGAFADNGQGVRGDMKAVIRAVLLDPEARDELLADRPTWGRLREPILRVSAWLRAFGGRSTSGNFTIPQTDDPVSSIGQTPMRAPSVFNWYRPGYVPPNSAIADAGMVAPEMQITHESSVAGYLNTMRSAVQNGFGSNDPATGRRDVQPDYSRELGLAGQPELLVDRVALLLTADRMSPDTRAMIRDAVASVTISTTNQAAAETARLNRVRLAVFLTLASPDFLVQK